MHHTKSIFMALALFAVALVILPSYAQAATYEQAQLSINLQPGTAGYTAAYNAADDTEPSNDQSWNPLSRGIWIGGPTPESLFSFREMTLYGATLDLLWENQFKSVQIMDGVSKFTIRSPVYIDKYVSLVQLELIVLSSTETYSAANGTLTFNGTAGTDYFYVGQWITYAYDGSSGFGYDSWIPGDKYWTQANRNYATLDAIIEPNLRYLWHWTVSYYRYDITGAGDVSGKMQVYMSQDDVSSDFRLATNITSRVDATIDTAAVLRTTILRCDLGVSFDMRQGIGGSVCLMYFDLLDGQSLKFKTWSNQYGNAYSTLMVPFKAVGNITADVSVTGQNSGSLISTDLQTWQGYIMASSTTTHPFDGRSNGLIDVTITVSQDCRIGLFVQSPTYVGDVNDLSRNGTNAIYIEDHGGPVSNAVGRPYAVYSLSDHVIEPPTYWPGMDITPKELPAMTIFDALFMILFFGPIGAVAGMLYHGSTGQYLSSWILTNLALIAMNSITAIHNFIWGAVNGVLAAIASVLIAIGNFIVEFARMIVAAISWLVDALISGAATIISILCLLVVIVIFIVAVWGQTKLWTIGLKLAQGDVEGAAAQAQQVVSAVEKGAEVGGKIGGAGLL